MGEERSINRVGVQTPSRTVTLSWREREDLVARLIAGYPTTHGVVWQFRAAGTSRQAVRRIHWTNFFEAAQ